MLRFPIIQDSITVLLGCVQKNYIQCTCGRQMCQTPLFRQVAALGSPMRGKEMIDLDYKHLNRCHHAFLHYSGRKHRPGLSRAGRLLHPWPGIRRETSFRLGIPWPSYFAWLDLSPFRARNILDQISGCPSPNVRSLGTYCVLVCVFYLLFACAAYVFVVYL